MSRAEWQEHESAHAARADRLTVAHLARRGAKHPVEDFLFRYYNFPPGKLRRWHPGPGVVLDDAGRMPRATWSGYLTLADGGVTLDHAAVATKRATTITFVRSLLSATMSRPAFTGCFGLHEWAMVYRLAPGEVRHEDYPLRLSPTETDRVVESHSLRCSHFDAYRFFTPEAVPRNATQPTREGQVRQEQPGCLHAGMDVYKWAHKLTPLVPGDVLLDAFELARDIRVLDMRASPYDLVDLGYAPIRIETPEGKSEYAAAQRAFSVRSNDLRRRLLAALDAVAID